MLPMAPSGSYEPSEVNTTLNGAPPSGGLAVATATGGMFGAVTATGLC